MTTQTAYIVAAVRTPVGKAPRGAFRHTRPDDLLAHVLRGIVQPYPQLDLKEIQDVIVGCAMPEAEQGLNVARMALLLAGFPNTVAGVTVNRFCASGLQAIAYAADRIRLGEADIMIAAGTESMSLIPNMGNKPALNPAIFSQNEQVSIAYGMGMTAEKVAARWKISRTAQDEFALNSHQKAQTAIDAGYFQAEIIPYTTIETTPSENAQELKTNHKIIKIDEGVRRDTTLENLAKLKPVFAANGTVTAGNSSQMSDGAAAILLMSERKIKELNITPLARFVGYAIAGVAPEIMGIGPITAIPKALQQTHLTLNQIDWIELNEAFAAQSLAVQQTLEINPLVINPQGSAIALGHPLGATGAIRTATLLHGLKRTQKQYGMVTMCVGTGMGAAGIFEAI